MKNSLLIALAVMLLIACGPNAMEDHNEYASRTIKEMVPPIILVGKDCGSFGCSVIVSDANGRIEILGNVSVAGRIIGESFNKGDTVIHKITKP